MPLAIFLTDDDPGFHRFGNKIFQSLIAEKFMTILNGDVQIFGSCLEGYFKAENLGSSDVGILEIQAMGAWVELTNHLISYELIAEQYRTGLLKSVIVSTWGMQIETLNPFNSHLTIWLDDLLSDIVIPEVSNNDLLIHLRMGDISNDQVSHADYYPLPISYYQKLVKERNLNPVFVGQLTNKIYVEKLRDAFPLAEFYELDILESFKLIRQTKAVAMSISSFCFVAAWTGRKDSTIEFPVAGLMNPNQRPDINLLPLNDSRFKFWRFPILRRLETEGLDDFLFRLESKSLGYEPYQMQEVIKE